MKEENKVIVVSGLQKSFGEQMVLQDLSLDLYKGENLVVLGRSGSGKSVLIKCIVRLMSQDKGTIEVLGQRLEKTGAKDLAELRKKIGFLFQSGALYDSMTVRENLEFPLLRMQKKISRRELNEKTMKVLENVGLSDAIDKMPSQLSGGMRKRIALARTIIIEPEIVLYDEPTTGLDPITSSEISGLINDIRTEYKTSSLIITHDIACAKKIADRILVLRDGSAYAQGTLEEIHNLHDPWIDLFFNE
jgi:phospholipid/cholesterol/gamma-HCH transport system ATP-binding protein